MTTRGIESMTIGEFGRRAGLSIKALRLYEASGLLPPATVDASKYRYLDSWERLSGTDDFVHVAQPFEG